MTTVGFIGWRGMVGSVLMERMREERDFDAIKPTFFTTSNVGGPGPSVGKPVGPLKDANDVAELARHDVLISCQGGDYTKSVFPKLRAAGACARSTRRTCWRRRSSGAKWSPTRRNPSRMSG